MIIRGFHDILALNFSCSSQGKIFCKSFIPRNKQNQIQFNMTVKWMLLKSASQLKEIVNVRPYYAKYWLLTDTKITHILNNTGAVLRIFWLNFLHVISWTWDGTSYVNSTCEFYPPHCSYTLSSLLPLGRYPAPASSQNLPSFPIIHQHYP